MRAKQFIFEYNQAKTAQVFGNKLVTALANDRSSYYPNALGTVREYLRQKDKIGADVSEEHKALIVNYILTALESADPTPNKEYTQWLAKCYANEAQKIEDLTSKGKDWLTTYHAMKTKKVLPPAMRNIANYRFSDLWNIVFDGDLLDKLEAAENAPSKNKGNAELVYENDQVKIIQPKDEPAACYYGQGTRWCTAAKNNNMFDRYNSDGPMYILIPKHPEYDGEKYQIHFDSGQYMDERDHQVPVLKLITGRFGDLREFFKGREPELDKWIIFVDDDIIEEGLRQIREIAEQHVNDILTKWEMDDDYYMKWLDEQGYWNSDTGEMDYDKMSEDGVDYLSYNDEARKYYRKAQSVLNPSASTIKEVAQELSEDHYDNEPYPMANLEWVVSHVIKNEFRVGYHVEDGGLADFVNAHIGVKYNPESKEIKAWYIED